MKIHVVTHVPIITCYNTARFVNDNRNTPESMYLSLDGSENPLLNHRHKLLRLKKYDTYTKREKHLKEKPLKLTLITNLPVCLRCRMSTNYGPLRHNIIMEPP